MWRDLVADIDGPFMVSATELRDVRHSSGIQAPKGVLVEWFDPFFKPDLDAVEQEIVLPQKVSLLHLREQCRRILLSNRHKAGKSPIERYLHKRRCRDDSRTLSLVIDSLFMAFP